MRTACQVWLTAASGVVLLACSGSAAGLSGGSDAGGATDAQPDVVQNAQDSGGSPRDSGAPAMDAGVQDSGSAPETGATCQGCTAPANATPTCQGGACGFVCNTGYAVCGTACCIPYRHTITIDGVNDFTTASEQIATTSANYDDYVTWDATSLYLGFDGSDIAAGATGGQTFLFAYVDKDPGGGTGATTGQEYGTQTPKFPNGFGADYELAWNPGTGSLTLSIYQMAQWVPLSTTSVSLMRGGSFVEMSIPLSTVGVTPGSKLGLVTMMMYTHAAAEWSYAGMWSGSFTDGYYGMVPISFYFRGDLSSSTAPNAMTDRLL